MVGERRLFYRIRTTLCEIFEAAHQRNPAIRVTKITIAAAGRHRCSAGGDAAFQKWLSTAAVLGGKAKDESADRSHE